MTTRMATEMRRVRREARFWVKTERVDGCLVWTGARTPAGYGRVCFEGQMELAHRVAWRLARGPFDPRLDLLHSCDNPPCVDPDHLRLGTDAENVDDRRERGRSARMPGASNGRAKLTAADVLEIRDAYTSGGTSYRKLAARYGVVPRAIRLIVTGQTWRAMYGAAEVQT